MWKLNLNSFFLSNFEKKFGRLQILLREKTGFCDNIFRDKLQGVYIDGSRAVIV